MFAIIISIIGIDASHAQEEHPFIGSFDVTVLDGSIQLHWVMQGGSTCDGSEVERSTNGTDFIPIHRIEGICGDAQFDVPFSYLDQNPPELSTLYYRIKLGFEGVSSVKTVIFDQLIDSEHRFHPSPMRDEATLLLNVTSSASVELYIFDPAGRSVYQAYDLTGREHKINMPSIESGAYIYLAISGGKRFTGKFVKE